MKNAIIYAVNTFKEMVKDYIWLFGDTIKAIFRRNTMSITETLINQTMHQKTLSFYPFFYTFPYIQERQRQRNEQESILKKQLNMPLDGINQKRVENGIVSMQKRISKNGNGLKKPVKFVKDNIKRLNNLLTNQNTAISIVKCVPCGVEEVYNLTVPSIKHFTVEGGIVVHNCADETRYMLMSLHERKTPKMLEGEELAFKKMMERHQVKQDINSFYYGNS